ncbi:serine/threonine-protein kinase [Melittangium boletus]|uniref:Serine/threonine protein kinase n=1 Tax=Melittangium boletus DSM 14713 TaxID=1294270 RepID=A0A250IFM6_9BACT|nr:serine/threonine-protein kinase [Melittangium boletus]ATB30624.1 serine/threonine protein kinase [Melittangium boletus DSM 14713]
MDREHRFEEATLDTWGMAEPTNPVARHGPASKPVRVDMRGRLLGHYRLVKHLGSGGMGSVYLAEQRLGGPQVAVKVLHPELSQDAGLRARFSAEARTVNLIGHPNIVRILDIDDSRQGPLYFVMEYLKGTPLSRLPRPMEPGLLVWLLSQACDALEAVHRGGVVHRDLKPDNLLLVERPGEAPLLKVLDFGVARTYPEALGPERSSRGQVLGTPAYMAPEQWAGELVDGRADVYALGVTGYLLATGQLPFSRGQLAQRVFAPHGPPPPRAPHELAPSVPERLSRVLLRALARQPWERFASAADFKQALCRAVRARPGPYLPSSPTRAQTPSRLLIPAQPLLPEPNDPTPPPAWVARVRYDAGEEPVVVHCSGLNPGGLLMSCAEPLPPLATRLDFTLQMGGEAVDCVGEVVLHVEPAQARAQSLPTGVVLRFLQPSPRLRELLHRLDPSRGAAARPFAETPEESPSTH